MSCSHACNPAARPLRSARRPARDADEKKIKDAFRELALEYHPDRNKEPGAEKKFKEIAGVYAVLSDPKKRAEYDTGGFAGVAGCSAEDLVGGRCFDLGFSGDGHLPAAASLGRVEVEELIPESHHSPNHDFATLAGLTGFVVMMVLDLAFR